MNVLKNLFLVTTTAISLLNLDGLVCTPAQAITIIDTTPFWNGTQIVEQFGENLPYLTAAFGQTFTVPETDNVLTSFTLFAAKASGQVDDVNFIFYVMEWDASTVQPVGSVLFKSNVKTLNQETLQLQSFTFNPQVALTSGVQYVAFVSDVELLDGVRSAGRLGFLDPNINVYSGGNFVIGNFLQDFSDITTPTWTNTFFPQSDIAFIASFAIPEPLTVFGTGMALCFGTFFKYQNYKKNIKNDDIKG